MEKSFSNVNNAKNTPPKSIHTLAACSYMQNQFFCLLVFAKLKLPEEVSPPPAVHVTKCCGTGHPGRKHRDARNSYQSIRMQTKAHGDGSIDLMHHRAIHPAHVLPQPLFIQGANLLQQDYRVLG